MPRAFAGRPLDGFTDIGGRLRHARADRPRRISAVVETEHYADPNPEMVMAFKDLAALALMASVVAVALPASAAQPYLDDRSTAADVIRSYYNAINRHEYARAYSYFGANNAPSGYQRFADGFADTRFVALAIGKVSSEGAAGSTYYSVPVAIDALSTSGRHRQYAGCYTLRLAQPTIQEPPFQGIHIEKGSLKSASGPLRALVPKCDH